MKAFPVETKDSPSLVVYHPASCLGVFLKDLLGLSSTALKKLDLPKKFLDKKVERGFELSLSLNALNHGQINPSYEGPSMKILFEDENLLALDKAPFIHSHPLSYLESDNVLSFLRATRDDELLNVNQAHYDRGLLYRLDYETSGVLVYVKKEELYLTLRDQFSTCAKEKIYHAVVRGHFDKEGEQSHYFRSFGEKGKKNLCSLHPEKDSQKGTLSVRLLAHNEKKNLSLVEVKLTTGLRHQIRSQLAFLGFPLLGDELYGGEKAERLYLNAHSYTLELCSLSYKVDSSVSFCDLFM